MIYPQPYLGVEIAPTSCQGACPVGAQPSFRSWFRYSKGSHSKGRNVFLKDIEPFIKWLKEAEEEDEDDEEEDEDES